jgi:hypothetical protein
MENPSYFSCDEVVRGVESSYAGSSAFAPRISKGARVLAGGAAIISALHPHSTVRISSPKSPMTVHLLPPGSITSLHHTGIPCSLHAGEADKIKPTRKMHNSNEYPTPVEFLTGRLLHDVAMFLPCVVPMACFHLHGLSVESFPDRAETLKDPEAHRDTSPPACAKGLMCGLSGWPTSKGAR